MRFPSGEDTGKLKIPEPTNKLRSGALKIPVEGKMPQTAPSALSVSVPQTEKRVFGSLPKSAPSPDRSTLLQVGQDAFKNARKTTSASSSDERKRLIEEGRRLLHEVRSADRSKGAPPPPAPQPAVLPAVNDNEAAPDEWDFDDDLDI